jgi:hypothetical protein
MTQSWRQRAPMAWAWTRGISARWCIPTSRQRLKRSFRRADGEDGTVNPHCRWCCSHRRSRSPIPRRAPPVRSRQSRRWPLAPSAGERYSCVTSECPEEPAGGATGATPWNASPSRQPFPKRMPSPGRIVRTDRESREERDTAPRIVLTSADPRQPIFSARSSLPIPSAGRPRSGHASSPGGSRTLIDDGGSPGELRPAHFHGGRRQKSKELSRR